MTVERADAEMKPTGVVWLEANPRDWRMARMKTIFTERTERCAPGDAHLTPSQKYGVLTQLEYMERTGSRVVLNLSAPDNMKHVESGDFISHLRSFQGGLERSEVSGKVSTAYTVLRPKSDVYGPFFRYLMKSNRYIQALRTTTNQLRDGQSIRFRELDKVSMPVPPMQQQELIAEFLDRETAKIDAVIEKQHALIDGLRMRKESTVRDAFCAPEADTDARVIAHLGAVPSSWAVRPLWSLYRREKRTGYTDEPMVSVFREHGVVYKDDHANLNVTAENRSIYQLVEPGWLVVNRMKAWQGSVGVSALRGISSGHYLCFRPLEDLHHPFMNWLFRSPQYRDWFAAHSRGVRPGQAEIDNEHLKSAPVILPPHIEQQRIADHLDREIARIDALITRSERLIKLSQERRSALITAAVTGQIDVLSDTMTLQGAA